MRSNEREKEIGIIGILNWNIIIFMTVWYSMVWFFFSHDHNVPKYFSLLFIVFPVLILASIYSIERYRYNKIRTLLIEILHDE